MQTILGSNGQIGYELANELYQNYTKEIWLVWRPMPYGVIPLTVFQSEATMNRMRAKQLEILVRYQFDNVFITDKFMQRFPDFHVTSFTTDVQTILH